MKEIKTFTREQLYIYKYRGSEKLSIALTDFEHTLNLPYACYKEQTFSGPYHSYAAPTCIFFTENVLKDDYDFSDNLEFLNVGSRGWVPEGNFLKIGFRLGAGTYEGWICADRFNNAPQDKKEILAQNFPQYFSDEPEFRRGFFNENLNEKIERIFTTNPQIERVMEDYYLSLEQKSYLLFGRTPEHVFNFGMCSFDVPDAVKEIAEENGGTIYVDAYNTYLREKGDITVRTVMCLNSINQPFDLQESWDYYVKKRPCKYYSEPRSQGFAPLNWYKYLKAVIETFEEAVKYTDEPTYKRGFFNEGNQNTLREEMKRKVIGSGHGWRIVCRNFKPVSWDRTRYKPGVIVVRLPNSRHNSFMCTPVVTEGVSGQPQLTFDDPAKAQEYCDKLNRISNIRHWEITKTRNNYECYKIPLGSGMEAWLATSNFPPQGSPEWKHLCDLFPDYFKNFTRGFFTESVDEDLVNTFKQILTDTNGLSEDEKAENIFKRNIADITFYNCTILFINHFLEEYEYDVSSAKRFLNNSTESFVKKFRENKKSEHILNLCQKLIEKSPERKNLTLPEYTELNGMRTIFRDYVRRCEHRGYSVFYCDGAGSDFILNDSTEIGMNLTGHGKFEINEIGTLWQDYINLMDYIDSISKIKTTRGFFEESLADGNPSNNEITEIINNDILSDDEVCEKLFGGRNQDYILNACYHHCAWYKGRAPDGTSTPNCDRLGVTCPFIISNFSEPTLNIRESYQAYVEGKEFNGESRWSRAHANEWWADIVRLYTFWEEHDAEEFTGPTNHLTRGFFDECVNKEE